MKRRVVSVLLVVLVLGAMGVVGWTLADAAVSPAGLPTLTAPAPGGGTGGGGYPGPYPGPYPAPAPYPGPVFLPLVQDGEAYP